MLKGLVRRINEWSRVRRDIGRLKQLDNYLLDDMGIARESIEARVSGSSEGAAAGALRPRA